MHKNSRPAVMCVIFFFFFLSLWFATWVRRLHDAHNGHLEQAGLFRIKTHRRIYKAGKCKNSKKLSFSRRNAKKKTTKNAKPRNLKTKEPRHHGAKRHKFDSSSCFLAEKLHFLNSTHPVSLSPRHKKPQRKTWKARRARKTCQIFNIPVVFLAMSSPRQKAIFSQVETVAAQAVTGWEQSAVPQRVEQLKLSGPQTERCAYFEHKHICLPWESFACLGLELYRGACPQYLKNSDLYKNTWHSCGCFHFFISKQWKNVHVMCFWFERGIRFMRMLTHVRN